MTWNEIKKYFGWGWLVFFAYVALLLVMVLLGAIWGVRL